MKELVHFAHGNGFPSRCYSQFLKFLEKDYSCSYIEKIGHDPKYPVTENWDFLVDELIASVLKHNEQVIGVGHSLGGVLTFLAAIKEPQLFKSIVLIDAPILNRIKSQLVKLAKLTGTIDRLTPAFRTLSRKQHWEDKDNLISYLKTRPLFKTFTEECLNDYITYGFSCDESGCSLSFDKQIEYTIFKTIPHQLYVNEGALKTPCYLIYGTKSNVVDRLDRHYMRKYFSIKIHKMTGTHMLPMEYPEELALKIIALLK